MENYTAILNNFAKLVRFFLQVLPFLQIEYREVVIHCLFYCLQFDVIKTDSAESVNTVCNIVNSFTGRKISPEKIKSCLELIKLG